MSNTKFSWECPYCNKGATITYPNYSSESHIVHHDTKDGHIGIYTKTTTCPNPVCKEYTISLHTYKTYKIGNYSHIDAAKKIDSWQLKPNSMAKNFPSYIPKAILDDYNEACLIRDLSPKASATLSRRCLQGMIRDFWQVSGKPNLYEEIKAIEQKIDPSTLKAILAVKDIGNIGAHMEQDVNLIIDVEKEEAQALIRLIEILLKDWYIAKHERDQHLAEIVNISATKKEQKKPQKESLEA